MTDENRQTILSTAVTVAHADAARAFLNRFSYSTTALLALAEAMRSDLGDETGADMVTALVPAMAAQEAESI